MVAGLPLAESVMEEIDHTAVFEGLVDEGAHVKDGDALAKIEGPARGILTAERTMLNFLIHLCGVATQSRRFADAVAGTGVKVVDTRKTIPGLRAWEKQAVVHGGCGNHQCEGVYSTGNVYNGGYYLLRGVLQPVSCRAFSE